MAQAQYDISELCNRLEIAKTLGSTSIKHWSDTTSFASDRCQIEIFATWVSSRYCSYFNNIVKKLHIFQPALAVSLSCYLQNFVDATSLELCCEQNEMSIKYNHVGKGRLWNGPADTRRNNNAIIREPQARKVRCQATTCVGSTHSISLRLMTTLAGLGSTWKPGRDQTTIPTSGYQSGYRAYKDIFLPMCK